MRYRKIAALALLVALLAPAALASGGEFGSSNYIYELYTGQLLAAPPAYVISRSITARDLEGVDSLANLADACVTENGIYVLSADKLIILDLDFKVRKYINTYTVSGEEFPLTGMTGIFVTEAGDYYIAQSEQSRILHFNSDNTFRRALERPEIAGFENVNYRPTKLAVDSAGRIYVIAKGMYEGIVELRPDGSFSRFYGVNEIQFSFFQLVWRTLATDEQRARMQLWLPTDFTNLCIDSDGFIYATVQGNDAAEPIKRLNAKGENIIKVEFEGLYPFGDLWVANTGRGIPTGNSEFIAVDTTEYGVYVVLDSKRSRIFAYNADNKLLYVLGGIGDREGYFRNPIDVDILGDKIIVLDALAQSIEVFEPTEYGRAINNAAYYQYNYDYETASGYWREALEYNHNLTIAYSGIGRSLLRDKKYSEALEYLEMGKDRKYYTIAFERVRNDFLREHFVLGVSSIAGLVVLWQIVKFARRRVRRAKV